MPKVFFLFFYAKSHFFASFRLAVELKQKGYRIIYGGPHFAEKTIKDFGFEFKLVNPPPVAAPIEVHLNKSRILIEKFEKMYLNKNLLEKVVKDIAPSLIILDTSFIHYSIDLIKYNLPIIIAQTMLPLDKQSNVPPINSSIIPKKSFLSKLRIELTWQFYYVKRFLTHANSNLKFGTNEVISLKRKSKKLKLDFGQLLDFRRYLHYGIPKLPEIVFPSNEFNFPYKKKRNQFFLGYNKQIMRDHPPKEFPRYYKLKTEIEKKPLIYCAFGTLSSSHYKKVFAFSCELIKTAQDMEEYNFVISIGRMPEHIYQFLEPIPKNVYILESVPQLEILKKASAMITHGGINSIMECILNEVPMIVLPLVTWLDQIGNAARVKYHGVGLRGNISKETKESIKKKLKIVSKDPGIKTNLGALKSKILASDEFMVSLEFIIHQIESFQLDIGFKKRSPADLIGIHKNY